MYLFNPNLLKLFYSSLLINVPSFNANPFNNNRILTKLEVNPYSTYINYKLNPSQVNKLNSYISEYSKDIQLVPLSLSKNSIPAYYISINIYNCTSPIFMNSCDIIRCELNTYIKTSNNKYGTLILDYLSNSLSLDPINIFKTKTNNIKFALDKDINTIYCESKKDKIILDMKYSFTNKPYHIGNKLISFTDLAYYKNGIADRVYYDSSLVNAKTKLGKIFGSSCFKYRDMIFHQPDSLFYFTEPIRFIGSVWDNLV